MKNVFVEVHSLILSPWVDHSVIIILNVILWHTPLLHVHVGHGVKNSFAQVPFAFADSQQLGLQKRWPIRTCWAGHNHGYPCERTGKKEASPKGSGHATSSRGEGNCRKESEWFSGSGAHPPPPNTTTLYQGSYCMYNMTIRWMFTMNPKGTIWELQSLNAIYSIRVSSCPALNGLSVCRGGEKVQKKCRKSAVKSAVNSLRRCAGRLLCQEWPAPDHFIHLQARDVVHNDAKQLLPVVDKVRMEELKVFISFTKRLR